MSKTRESHRTATTTLSPASEVVGLLRFEAEVKAVSESPIVSALLESVDAGLLVLNAECQILAANRAPVLELFHAPRRRLIGLRPGEAFLCPQARANGCGSGPGCLACGALRAIKGCQSRGHAVEEECLMTSADGSPPVAVELHVKATPIIIEGEHYTVVSLRDISHEKRRRTLERVFFHDILNTLSGLSNWSHVLSASSGEAMHKARDRIIRLVRQLEAEIHGQRALLDAESGTLEAHRTVVSPGNMLAELHAAFAESESAQQRSLAVDDGCPGIELATDPVLLRRVLTNMLKNAFEATPPGGRVRLWCEMDGGAGGSSGDGPAVVFSVHNEGEIPPAVAGRIFQRSFSTKGGPGRGLGTYGMKLLGERVLGGKISFITSAEGGTVFSFRLPMASPRRDR